ncbi:hypothetical protein ACWEVP_44755 [Amycolatopsis sp. NPDC003865]
MLFGFLSLHLGLCCPAGHATHDHAPTDQVVAFQAAEPAPEHQDCDPAPGHHRSHGVDDTVCRGFRSITDGSWLEVLALAALAALVTGREPPVGNDLAAAGPPVVRSGPHYLIELCVSRT